MKNLVVGLVSVSLLALTGCQTPEAHPRTRRSMSLGASVSSRGDLTFTVSIAPVFEGESRKPEPPKPAAATESKSAPVALNVNTSVGATPKKAASEPAKEMPKAVPSPRPAPPSLPKKVREAAAEKERHPKGREVRTNVRTTRS